MDKRHINPEDHYSIAPASQAVRCGNTIYVAGQCALDRDLNVLHPGDLVKQTAIAVENVRKVLAACGAGLDDIVKMTTFYVSGGSREDWEVSVRERLRHFTGPGPASTVIPVSALVIPGLVIEIEAIAMID